MFFTTAAAVAYRRVRATVGGMCETDYSGYPVAETTLKALQVALTSGSTELPPCTHR